MKNKLFFIIFLFFFSPSIFSQEIVTISTYYPAPSGAYQNIRLFPTAVVPVCDSNSEGMLYYDSGLKEVRICRESSPGVFGWESLAAADFWTLAGTSPNQYLYPNDNTWKVGIGAVPVNKLDVEGSAAIGASYSGTNTAPSNGLLVEGSTGIGTATPVNKLDVEGSVAIGSSYSGTNTAPSNGLLVEGNVGIGTTSPGTNKLDVTGNIHSTGDVCTDQAGGKCFSGMRFGGAFSCYAACLSSSCGGCVSGTGFYNPYTGAHSCPSGYTAVKIAGGYCCGSDTPKRCSFICVK